jgi:hypothetical protein
MSGSGKEDIGMSNKEGINDEEYIRHFLNIDNTLSIEAVLSKQYRLKPPHTSLGEIDWRFLDKDSYQWQCSLI